MTITIKRGKSQYADSTVIINGVTYLSFKAAWIALNNDKDDKYYKRYYRDKLC